MMNRRTKLSKFKTKMKKNNYLRILFKKQMDHTKEDARGPLTKDELFSITLLALVSAFLTVWTKVMIWMRWSTFPDNSYFASWHPYTPILAIIASSLFIYCLWRKGVSYWLAYFPAFFAIIYYIIELCMINAWLHPEFLKSLFGPLAEHLPEWLTGGPV